MSKLLPDVYYRNDSPIGTEGANIYVYNASSRWGSTSMRNLTVNPYAVKIQHSIRPQINYEFNGSTDEGTVVLAPTNVDPGSPSLAKAHGRLLRNYRSTDLNLGVSLAEGKDSVRMIADRAQSLSNAARAVISGSPSGAFRYLKAATSDRRTFLKSLRDTAVYKPADLFLEMKFGWMPLLEDIHAASDLLKPQPIQNNISSSHKVVAKSKGHRNASRYQYDYSNRAERGYRTFMKVSQTPNWPERLGLTDPSVLWQATSLSFLVDWFIPITSVIQSTYLKLFVPSIRSGRTVFYTERHHYSNLKKADSSVWKIQNIQGNIHWNQIQMNRYVGLGGLNLTNVIPYQTHVENDSWTGKLHAVTALAIQDIKNVSKSSIVKHKR